MPETHLKRSRFTYSACRTLTKNKERTEKSKEAGDTSYISRNELAEAFFRHHMAYGGFKDFARKAASDTVVKGKAFNITKNSKNDVYQRGIASMVYKSFDEKSKGSGVSTSLEPNEELAEELHKAITRTFKKEQFTQDLKTIFGEFEDLI